MIELPRLILASGSPRRAEILMAVGWGFDKDVPDIDESEIPGEHPADYVQRLARTKAEVIATRHQGRIVLGADTTVVIDGRIIGKPADLNEAETMINLLSGSWHEVLTGVAIVTGEGTKTGVESTRVKFAEMSESEIRFLVENGGPLDKAGAYAVQAQAALFIEAIEGDYWNVVGLPVRLVYKLVGSSNISHLPVFGKRLPDVQYQERPAAYVVVMDANGRVAAIAGQHGHFLPGGGLEIGENPEGAIKREISEELGASLEIEDKIGEAVQYSSVDGKNFRMTASFYRGQFIGESRAQPQYDIHWLSKTEIDQTIFQESHRWAIGQAAK